MMSNGSSQPKADMAVQHIGLLAAVHCVPKITVFDRLSKAAIDAAVTVKARIADLGRAEMLRYLANVGFREAAPQHPTNW
jgi:hypothetical protein